MKIRNFLILCVLFSPVLLNGQLQKKLESIERTTAPNSLNFYKVVLEKPIKLTKFKKWLKKNKKYHIVYYNTYKKLISGANQTVVSRIGFLPKREATKELVDSYIKQQSFIKKFMVSDHENVDVFRVDLEEKERLAFEESERQRKITEARAKARREQAEKDRIKRSMGIHCIEVEKVRCSNGQFTFRLTNTCELPFQIKYVYLSAYKKATVDIVSVPPKAAPIETKGCAGIDPTFYYVSHSSNPLMFGKKSDEEMALEILIDRYDDVYYCRRCNGEGVLSCNRCGGDGLIEVGGGNIGYSCTQCSGGSNTCGRCNGHGVFGLD